MRILLVEDEPKVSGFVQRGLTAERYAVDVCPDGREGLEMAQSFPYDLIILDMMLPRLDGGEVLQRIRRTNSHVPVLMLTARDSVEDKVKKFLFDLPQRLAPISRQDHAMPALFEQARHQPLVDQIVFRQQNVQ